MSRRQFALPQWSPAPADTGPVADNGCSVLHVDMDAFYASASLLSHPELVGTPVIIGGGNRGVVLSASYEARAHGVTSAMPMARARRLCPRATVIPPDHDRYQRISRAVMAVFAEVTPKVEPLSLDEAFLDVSGAARRLGRPTEIAQAIRDTIADEQGITCSVGVAPTKLVAKIASGLAKPDGLLVVPAAEVVTFLHQLPVAALWGVGDRTEEVLVRLGLRTIGDLAHTPVGTLRRALGERLGPHLHALAWGRDDRPGERMVRQHSGDVVGAARQHSGDVVGAARQRSIGSDETFPHDLDDAAVIHRHLLKLSDRTAARARAAGLVGRTVTLKVRFADFTTLTRSRTLRDPTDVSRELYAVARGLFDGLGLQRARLRLVGVRLEGLVEARTAPVQGLLDEPEHGWRDADLAVDRASARFGAGAVRPASLVGAQTARYLPSSGLGGPTPATLRRPSDLS
ncbi:MAG TPA: DNA polymerase IV [Segeticoccus sp.]|uniref:DNA polymerase IV n=1 Tax=Segeticoccus sp. TaxID=2706531 RepID=UPI002D7F0A65|nr:DNA polymerase IV [Segeticoccus sp.]HET8600278.1 DNA polymerase IV [Segeticoccus sp.]